jgi:hypothetical protein
MNPHRGICAVLVLLLCGGCVPYWYTAASSQRSPIDDQALKFITIGSTTMEDVLFELGEPEARYDAPPVFLYRWVEVEGVFGYPLGGRFWMGWTREHTLHIAFDESNKVTRYKISSVELSERSVP